VGKVIGSKNRIRGPVLEISFTPVPLAGEKIYSLQAKAMSGRKWFHSYSLSQACEAPESFSAKGRAVK
jgi:hypothetical protein